MIEVVIARKQVQPVLDGQGGGPEVIRRYRRAFRRREVTQPQALAIYDRGADALRWWSTFESSWINVTLFDRVAARLRVGDVRALDGRQPVVAEALATLGLAVGGRRRSRHRSGERHRGTVFEVETPVHRGVDSTPDS